MDIDKQLHLGTDKIQLLSPKSRLGVNIFFHTLSFSQGSYGSSISKLNHWIS